MTDWETEFEEDRGEAPKRFFFNGFSPSEARWLGRLVRQLDQGQQFPSEVLDQQVWQQEYQPTHITGWVARWG